MKRGEAPAMVALKAEWRAFCAGEVARKQSVAVPVLALTKAQREMRDRLLAKASAKKKVDAMYAEAQRQIDKNRGELLERRRVVCPRDEYRPDVNAVDPFERARAEIHVRRQASESRGAA